jgi:hypothetical protein
MKQKILNWYHTETKKDKIELDKEKLEFINQIKNINKSKIINETPKKLTLWERVLKVLTNT